MGFGSTIQDRDFAGMDRETPAESRLSEANVPTAWRASDDSVLNGLRNYVPNRQNWHETNPWHPGHAMQIYSLGGSCSLDRKRYTIVGLNGYSSYVAGNRQITTESQKLTCARTRSIRVQRFIENGKEEEEVPAERDTPVKPGPSPIFDREEVRRSREADEADEPDPHAGVEWGRDRLHVRGDATVRFYNRTLMGKGRLERFWSGGVVRLAGFEGVIAGGFYTRAIGGPSIAVSAFNTSDVYGGAIKLSVCRLLMAGLHYRAAKVARWNTLLYVRAAPFLIEPIAPKEKAPKKSGVMGKIQRLGNALARASKAIRWLFPPLDILYSVVKIAAIPFMWAGSKLCSRFRKSEPPPPVLKPRVHVRYGIDIWQSATRLTL